MWVKMNSSDEVEGGLTVEDFLPAAEALASRVDIPVNLTGGLRNLPGVDTIVAESKVQFFSSCRPLIKDIDFIQTLKQKQND